MNRISIHYTKALDALAWLSEKQIGPFDYNVSSTFPGTDIIFDFTNPKTAAFFSLAWS